MGYFLIYSRLFEWNIMFYYYLIQQWILSQSEENHPGRFFFNLSYYVRFLFILENRTLKKKKKN